MKYNSQTWSRQLIRRSLGAAAALFCLLIFARPGSGQIQPPPDIQVSGLKPANPQPEAGRLKPGLSVFYIFKFFRHIDEMPPHERAREMGRPAAKPGQPVLQLNHQFDKGPVFDSGENRGVGVYMNGYLRLSQPGRYIFRARSNDGIRIFINDQMIINDPDVHGERFSNRGIVDIKQAGWYDLKLQYFQRKGSAMLKLYWKIPGANARVIVPAEVLAHP